MPEARTFAARNAKIASETASRLPLIREPARPSWAISFLSMWRRCARRTITRPKNTQGGRLVLAGTHQGWFTRSRCNGSAPRHGGRVPQAQQSLPPPGPVRSLRPLVQACESSSFHGLISVSPGGTAPKRVEVPVVGGGAAAEGAGAATTTAAGRIRNDARQCAFLPCYDTRTCDDQGRISAALVIWTGYGQTPPRRTAPRLPGR